MKIRRLSPLLLLASLGGCDGQYKAEEPKLPVARLPAQVCNQAQGGLEKLKESGGLTYNGQGEATLEEEAWMRLDEGAREQLVQLVAYDAACKAAVPPAEQSATVRNEAGRVLSQRVVETSADLSGLVQE
ncbi:MAG: hypothetical protein M3N39_07490 [Pseudomonadota bacterium]|nr:hypothetical protein [Pseudomonadota bacterium]